MNLPEVPVAAANSGPHAYDILLIEDDGHIRDVLLVLFETAGLTTRHAPDGEAALALLSTRELPRLIILDLSMPVMDGNSFRERQLSDPALAGIPVIVFSAGPDLERRSAELGIELFLQKPMEASRLLDALEKYLGPIDRRQW